MPPDDTTPRRLAAFPWRSAFAATSTAVYVVGPSRRLRYANPAWERVTGKSATPLRGMRLSTLRSGSDLGRTLAVPPEVWAGEAASVRRAAPGAVAGPPWWDMTFTPLAGDGKMLAVVATLTVVGPVKELALAPVPEVVGRLRHAHAAHFGWHLWADGSAPARRLLAQARHAAAADVPVWVVGGPGAGKHTLARTLHHAGPRRDRAFVRVDGHAVQPYLVETQLFGKGSLASTRHVGTLYLADPAALPRDLQDKLAAWVGRPGGPRLVSGATRPAAALVAGRTLAPVFETDLSVLELAIPPLAARSDDLAGYAGRWAARRGPSQAREPLGLGVDASALAVLAAHDWPGNVRELFDALDQASAAAGGHVITPRHLPRFLQERHLLARHPRPALPPKRTLDAVLEGVERRLLELALAQADGSQADAARRLGINRTRLWRRLTALGLVADPKGTP